MKLKYKIFFIFSVVSVIPMIFLTTYAFFQYTHITNQRMEEISNDQKYNITETVSDAYASVRQVMALMTFADNTNSSLIKLLRPYSSPDCQMTNMEIYRASLSLRDSNQNIFYTYDFLNGVYVYTPAGTMISYSTAKNGSIPQHYDPTDDNWYQETLKLNGKLYLSTRDQHPMFESGRESIFFAQSITDTDTGKFLGVLMIDCSPSLFDLSSVNILGDMNLITLKNTENDSLYYSNLNKNMKHIARDTRNTIVSAVPHTPFEVAMTLDYASMRAGYQRVSILLIIFSGICILCILLLTWRISASLIHPVQELSSQMLCQRSSHQTSFRDYSYRKDEIGTLYRQYHAMLDELDASIKKDYQDKLILLDAQMKSLEARINSHFLFNTLESINSIAELHDNEQISTMSLALGNMFRYAIKTESELVTLQQELQHVNDYVMIQSIRFDNQFHLHIDVPQNLRSLKVLKLILQPLVENALCHGLNYCNSGDQISIAAFFKDSQIHITVSDNGRGISPEQLAEIRKHLEEEASFTELGHRNKQSIGLKNIQSRIELYYGKSYGLSIESQETVGTIIEITIPVLSE